MDQSPEAASVEETDILIIPDLENTARFISSTLSKLFINMFLCSVEKFLGAASKLTTRPPGPTHLASSSE